MTYGYSGDDANWMWWDHDQFGGAGFGEKDVAAAQSRGYTAAQIRILGDRAQQQGRMLGQKTQDWIQNNTPKLPWDYNAHGGAQFGMADINAAIGMGGATWNQLKSYSDYANAQKIGTGEAANKWFTDNKDNYEFFDAGQRRDVQLQDNLDAEARAMEQWKEQQRLYKEMNPRISSNNAQMKSTGSGGVAIKRSEAFRREGGTRSTAQSGRGMFIESLNI